MEAKDLRLGNYIYCFKKHAYGIHTVDTSTFSNVIDDDNRNKQLFKPIPVSKERLLELGFKHDDIFANFTKKLEHGRILGFDIANKHVFMGQWTNDLFQSVFVAKCDYIHQLQNLYFSLTGEELTIN